MLIYRARYLPTYEPPVCLPACLPVNLILSTPVSKYECIGASVPLSTRVYEAMSRWIHSNQTSQSFFE